MNGTATRLNESGSLVVGMGDRKKTVAPSEIIYLAGDSNYSRLIRSRKPAVMVSITITKYETILPDFIRVHKQYIVNPAFVKRLIPGDIHRNGAKIQLRNGKLLPVARRRFLKIQDQLLELVKRAGN
ncbi:LytTr DNA-binding domain-containing protein [Spirosoma oryzae]|uniref:LytTr DNA-binding domain-containing protein n=1 Tax=Spirosoma oryzae TaxID=1469603 RepID=A0A2T0TNA3_9BACT|nr:LytTR family DNA-binding domain-containing protein [Spirosoma oryzae]PRY47137.1 LytTr DNA-binding domain-containing protein [Spirosoma oryzae]